MSFFVSVVYTPNPQNAEIIVNSIMVIITTVPVSVGRVDRSSSAAAATIQSFQTAWWPIYQSSRDSTMPVFALF